MSTPEQAPTADPPETETPAVPAADAPPAAETPTPAEVPADPAADEAPADGASAALKAERQARRDAERRLRDAEDRATTLERDAARRSIAADLNLSEQAAGLIVGDDEQTMRKHAEQLIAAFRVEKHGRPAERLTAGAVPSSEPENTASDVANRVMKSGW